LPKVTHIDPRLSDYARRGANEFGVYVENVIEGRVRFSGGSITFRLVCDPADDKWRGSREVEGPLPPFYDGWRACVYDRAHDTPEQALRSLCDSARRAISAQLDGAANGYRRGKIEEALRRLDEWEARNLQKSLAAEGGDAVAQVMVGAGQ
jgi:hypothetical protein